MGINVALSKTIHKRIYLFALLQFNPGNIFHLPSLKAWLLMVALTVKNGNDRLRKGNRRSWGFVGWTYKLTVPKATVKRKWNTDKGRAWKLLGKITGVACKSRYYYNYIVTIIHDYYQYHIIINIISIVIIIFIIISIIIIITHLEFWKNSFVLSFSLVSEFFSLASWLVWVFSLLSLSFANYFEAVHFIFFM